MTIYTIFDRAGNRYATGDLSPEASTELERAITQPAIDRTIFVGLESSKAVLKINSTDIIAVAEKTV